MMKYIYVTVLLLFGFNLIQAQPKNVVLKGQVADSISKAPLEYATVTLFAPGNKKPITGTVTDKAGNYVVENVKAGTYTAVFEFIGYNAHSLKDVVITGTPVELEKILLKPTKANLQEVVVQAKVNLIENKIDKMVFNAEKDVSSQSGVATDILKKIPQVSVDVDGNVQLSGSGGVRFLINGKPSTAFGSSITDVLQSIPASQIKSVEVITNPGAKYDAAGLGGIINIILKTNKAKGYNGNISLTAGTRNENGSINLNARNNNFGANFFLSANKRLKSNVHSLSERFTLNGAGTDYLKQEGVAEFERHGVQTGAGFDWTVKEKNSITGAVSFNNFGNYGNGYSNQFLQLSQGSNTNPLLTLINSDNRFKFTNTDVSLNYKRTFAKEDQELELSANTSFGNGKNNSSNEQLYTPQQEVFYGTKSQNPGKTKETQIALDYTQPLGKDVKLGMGSKISFNDINSTSTVLSYLPATKLYQLNNSLANNLDYKQQVYAFYSELSFPVTKGLSAKIGGRYERTEINSYFSNAQQQVKVPGYNTIVPSAYLSQKMGEKGNLKLSYSKRIERPNYQDLNPFVNTNDPKNLSVGNPFLKPEIGHRMEFSYTKDFGQKGSGSINLFYRLNDNDIQPYITYYPSYKAGDSIYNNVAVSTRQNIGREKNMGVNLFGDLKATSKFSLRSNVFFFRRHIINTVDKGFNTTSFNYRFNLNANYQFAPTLVAEFFGNFNSARNEAQGKYPSFTTYSMAIRKQFWNKKGSLALTGSNFLQDKLNQKTQLSGPNFKVNSVREIPFRSIGLNFAWKFGKLEFKKQRQEQDGNLNTTPE